MHNLLHRPRRLNWCVRSLERIWDLLWQHYLQVQALIFFRVTRQYATYHHIFAACRFFRSRFMMKLAFGKKNYKALKWSDWLVEIIWQFYTWCNKNYTMKTSEVVEH